MNKEGKGFDKSQRGRRIENLPKTGHLTGSFEIDIYGCWWEVVEDETCKPFWIIGEYPSAQNKLPKKRNTRTLKVLERHYDPENPDSKYGEIRLRGKWLEDAGFSMGSRVKVTVYEGRIIIKRSQPDMKVFVVKSNDLFDRKKNPGLKLSVKSVLENPQIPKYCCQCGTELKILEIYEHGKEDTILVCFKCKEMKHG